MRILLYSIFFSALFVLYVRYLESRTLFVPSKDILADPAHVGLEFEDVYFSTQDNVKLNGWFIPAQSPRATLIFCHGNAGNIGDRLGKIKLFHDLRLNVFIFDYRGYGKSKGSPSEEGMYKDVLAAYDYLKSQDTIDHKRIVIYGASLGGAPAIDLAAQKDIAGVIVDSSFSNAVDMAKRIFPFIPSFLIQIKLDNINKIKDVHEPLLFFHSVDDEMVPYDLGRKLFEVANEPKEFIDLEGSHNDNQVYSESTFVLATERFIERITP